jgi:hypothetical protein
MKRQLIFSTLFLTTCLTSYGQKITNEKTINTEKTETQKLDIDTSAIAIIRLDSSTNNTFKLFKTVTETELTSEDFLKIETILKKCVEEYNPEQERQFKEINDKHPEYKLDKKNFIIDLTRYKRQYMATINSKGEKEIWINCFCGQWDKHSRTSPVIVMDGGNCYFNLKINLTTEQYYELMVNGDA